MKCTFSSKGCPAQPVFLKATLQCFCRRVRFLLKIDILLTATIKKITSQGHQQHFGVRFENRNIEECPGKILGIPYLIISACTCATRLHEKMRAGPSESACRSRLQTTLSCIC